MLKTKVKKTVIVLDRNFNVLKEARGECSLRTKTVKDKSKYDRTSDRKMNKVRYF